MKIFALCDPTVWVAVLVAMSSNLTSNSLRLPHVPNALNITRCRDVQSIQTNISCLESSSPSYSLNFYESCNRTLWTVEEYNLFCKENSESECVNKEWSFRIAFNRHAQDCTNTANDKRALFVCNFTNSTSTSGEIPECGQH